MDSSEEIRELRAQIAASHQREAAAHQRANALELLTQNTTLEECLNACHDHLQSALIVQTDQSLTTQGSTSIKNKFYPETLRAWDEYPDIQQRVFDAAHRYFHPPNQTASRLFTSIKYYQDLGSIMACRRMASEKDLETYERDAVENVVTNIINNLSGMPAAQTHFGLGTGLSFDNHPNALGDITEDAQERLRVHTPRQRHRRLSTSSTSSESASETKLPRTRADQFCISGSMAGARKLLLLVEYKPPHKLSTGNLQAGLREMNLREEVFDRATIPVYSETSENSTEEDRAARDEKLQYNADKLVSAVVTQTFHTMIDFGLEYGYITNGEAFVCLRIREDDPKTLYYHLSIPSDDVRSEHISRLSQTAVSQVMSICLMAFQTSQRHHNWRRTAKQQLQRYRIDYESILREIPESERKQTPSIAYRGRKNPDITRSPYLTRRRAKDAARVCRDSISDVSDSDDSSSNGVGPSSPSSQLAKRTKSRDQLQKGNQKPGKADKRGRRQRAEDRNENRQRPYCTQACLVGVSRKGMMDGNCPNASQHPSVAGCHAIDAVRLVELLRQQLAADPDCGCEPLGLQGARGALFKITLASYSYVLVAKGTTRALAPILRYETRVYRHLRSLQGNAIPVCLGFMRLHRRYYLDIGVKISCMILMSWSGSVINDVADYPLHVRKVVEEVRRAGVEQNDIRRPNLLWNEERQRVMLIDFERAMYRPASISPTKTRCNPPPLQELSPNKRRNQDGAEAFHGRGRLTRELEKQSG